MNHPQEGLIGNLKSVKIHVYHERSKNYRSEFASDGRIR
jgi:hypothetical protein